MLGFGENFYIRRFRVCSIGPIFATQLKAILPYNKSSYKLSFTNSLDPTVVIPHSDVNNFFLTNFIKPFRASMIYLEIVDKINYTRLNYKAFSANEICEKRNLYRS